MAVPASVAAIAGCGALLGFGEDAKENETRGEVDGAAGEPALADASGDNATGESDGGLAPKRVFVTSERFTGDFGGRAQADARCAAAAAAAALSGTFIAYLAEEDGGHPSLRFPVDHTWVLLDPDASVAFSRSPARQATPAHAIRFDERGRPVSAAVDAGEAFAWTGVVTPPTYPLDQTCDGWTVASAAFAGYGNVTSTTATWQEQPATASECLLAYRLYCFEP